MSFDPSSPLWACPSFFPHHLLASSSSSSSPSSSLNHPTRMEDNNSIHANASNPPLLAPSPALSGGIQLQIPPFIYNSAPTLAPGGGAEVLPVGMLNDPTWFSNNGFTPQFSNQSFFPSKVPSPPSPDSHSTQHAQPYNSSTNSAPFEFESYTAPAPPNSLPPVQQLIPSNPAELRLFMSSSAAPSIHQGPFVAAAAAGTGAPSPLGLPVYSASGFDLLSILSRVASRPNPRVHLGPVDLTCSFVVVDVRRHDHPIVYCSPSFCRLTGYSESEVIGRNCRFLQSPDGQVQKGEARRFTSMEAVGHLKKSLSADKECQASILNYRKGGHAFVNLVTVIPVTGGVSGSPHEESDVVYHVGFQVDLTEQPNVILEKLRDGSYSFSSSQPALGGPGNPGQLHHGGLIVPGLGTAGAAISVKDRKSQSAPTIVMAKELKRLLSNPAFIKSIPISTGTTNPMPPSSASSPDSSELTMGGGPNQTLHLLLLEACPDFIHVVSLKGNFLYVAPSVRRVLGYEPEEMVGKSISDFSHSEDVVPLMRELKESSATGMAATTPGADGGPPQAHSVPRSVDMLFRARNKAGSYVWVECRGRLHVEPGKGRKAIILSGRAKEMPILTWESVGMGGGLTKSVRAPKQTEENGDEVISDLASEFWGMMSSGGKIKGTATFSMVGDAVQDVLGWSPSDLIGRLVSTIVVDDVGLEDEMSLFSLQVSTQEVSAARQIRCRMRRKDRSLADVLFIIYMPMHDRPVQVASCGLEGVLPAPFIFQVKLFDAVPPPRTSHVTSSLSSAISHSLPSVSLAHPLSANVFEELQISRGSSWQYELQQLKYANQRLLEEIALLEIQVQYDPSCQAAGSSPGPSDRISPANQSRSLYPGGGNHSASSHFAPPPIPSAPLEPTPVEHSTVRTHRPSSDMSMNVVPVSMQHGVNPRTSSEWSSTLSNSVPYSQPGHSEQRIYHANPPVINGSSLKRSWHAIDSTL